MLVNFSIIVKRRLLNRVKSPERCSHGAKCATSSPNMDEDFSALARLRQNGRSVLSLLVEMGSGFGFANTISTDLIYLEKGAQLVALVLRHLLT